jgi:hypothetical protein
MTKKTNAKSAAKPVSKAARKAPGNAKALADRAADNTAKLRKQEGRAEAIKTAVNARSGNGLVIETTRGRTIVIMRVDASVNKLSGLGMPVAPLEDYLKTQSKPQARLARGIDSGDAPQSAAAVASQRKAAKGTKPATTGKGKARVAKAAKDKAPSRGADRTYKLGTRKDESKPDTFRRYMLSTIMKHTSTAAAKAAHAKSNKYPTHKLDFNWSAQQGYIVFTK